VRPKRSRSITIKELHAKTGEKVREAALSNSPVEITDRGKRIALLVSARLVRIKPRRRTLLPEFKAYLAKPIPKTDTILKDLEAMRGDR
jgi:prevent-host-death family protein